MCVCVVTHFHAYNVYKYKLLRIKMFGDFGYYNTLCIAQHKEPPFN